MDLLAWTYDFVRLPGGGKTSDDVNRVKTDFSTTY